VATRAQKHLVLILAREFASNLATPLVLTDDDGTLVFFNEAAEPIVGRTFAETGELPFDEWSVRASPRTLEGIPIPDERRAPAIALRERRPAHEQVLVTALDGSERQLELTAFPLFAHGQEFLGTVLIFWPLEEA
jgi:PAS domain-containing protein